MAASVADCQHLPELNCIAWSTRKSLPIVASALTPPLLGKAETVCLLTQTLAKEGGTDEKLTQLAGSIDLQAAESEESDEGSNPSKKSTVVKAKSARA
jgi:hypothetical protein